MNLETAVLKLRQPKAIGVIPTDTVYGVVALAAEPEAVKRLYTLKKRDHKPGTIIAANLSQLEELGLKHRYLKAVEQFWPDAISVIIPTADPSLEYLHLGQGSLAIRLPKPPELQKLLEKTGPLLTTSANLAGQPTATTIKQAKAYFGSAVDFYIDGGDYSNHLPSTIIRIVDDAMEVVRQGAVKLD